MNVLFMMCDEMSWWGLGHMNPRVHTPNLDALAARGTRFDAAYTPSPICVPTRAAIACGKYVHETGFWSSAEAYDGSIPSWGHALQAAGKCSVSIGKLHYRNGEDDTGFDEQIEPVHIPGGVGWVRGLLRQPVCSYDATAELSEMIGPGDSEYLQFDKRVTHETLNWLAQPERKSQDWCAFVSWLSPHYPLIAPQDYYDLYDPKEFECSAEAVPDHPILQEIVNFFDHDGYFTNETRGIAIASYYALCSFLDAQVGQVLKALDASGQAEETLIIFTSDHGEMLGEKGFWTKSNMYESSARVPLILAGPDIAPGVTDTPVSLIDMAPTICAAMNVEATGFTGENLLQAPPRDRTVISEYHDGGSSVGITLVRWNSDSGAWKLVYYAEGHPPQLFNLTDDPMEKKTFQPAIWLKWQRVCAGCLRFLTPSVPTKKPMQIKSEGWRSWGGGMSFSRNRNGILHQRTAGRPAGLFGRQEFESYISMHSATSTEPWSRIGHPFASAIAASMLSAVTTE